MKPRESGADGGRRMRSIRRSGDGPVHPPSRKLQRNGRAGKLSVTRPGADHVIPREPPRNSSLCTMHGGDSEDCEAIQRVSEKLSS